ncbi:MAG TPA: putative DNA-binding domain-containing protein [Lysobacter sp.]
MAEATASSRHANAPENLRAQQLELTRHLRDPQSVPPPSGIEDRRLAIYRDLLFNNIQGLLAGNFPVIRQLLGDARWPELVRAFYRDHRCQTPLFPEIAREFLRYLEAQPALDPPFLVELAHYEWVELALQISDVSLDDTDIDPAGNLLAGTPVLSPLAWPLAYRWPVHRLGPQFQPHVPPDSPTLLLLRREPDGKVRFSELSPLAFRLLQRLGDVATLSGREQLTALAQEANTTDTGAFIDQGSILLEQMRGSGVILGTIAGEARL